MPWGYTGQAGSLGHAPRRAGGVVFSIAWTQPRELRGVQRWRQAARWRDRVGKLVTRLHLVVDAYSSGDP